MVDFAETGFGRTFFTHQIPEIMRSLKAIAKELRVYNSIDDTSDVIGKFEKITDDEVKTLTLEKIKFDEWFEQLIKNFDLDEKTEFDIVDLKKLCQHAYNK
jgi:tRNA U38,U39,U40 pseudouridine synthase TruA